MGQEQGLGVCIVTKSQEIEKGCSLDFLRRTPLTSKVRALWCDIEGLAGSGPILLSALFASTLFSAPAALAKLHLICLHCVVHSVLSLGTLTLLRVTKLPPRCSSSLAANHLDWTPNAPSPRGRPLSAQLLRCAWRPFVSTSGACPGVVSGGAIAAVPDATWCACCPGSPRRFTS